MDHFERSGLRFDVLDSGAPTPGTPEPETVVLLHGFPQQPSTFAAVSTLLQQAGVRTLVPSQRGYTPTARPRHRRDYRTEETVADVVALLDAAGLARAHVVGHDWGGFQAWGLGAWHPERIASLTVLSTPHPAALSESLRVSTQGLQSSYMALFQLPFLPEALAARTLARTLRDTRLPLRYVGRYCDAMAEPGALTGALNWYRGIPFSAGLPLAGRLPVAQRLPMANRPTVGPALVPTTYVWGRHDFALGRAAAERTEQHVHAPYAFVELDAGHWLPETEVEAVTEAVLNRVRG